MQILKRGDFGALIEQRANSTRGGVGSRKRRDAGNIVANRGAADGLFVVEGFAAQWRVDDQIDFASFHEVDDIGAAFIYFEHGFGGNAGGFERRGGAARGQQTEAKFMELFSEGGEVALVAVVYA